jgi:hypothetical protein
VTVTLDPPPDPPPHPPKPPEPPLTGAIPVVGPVMPPPEEPPDGAVKLWFYAVAFLRNQPITPTAEANR